MRLLRESTCSLLQVGRSSLSKKVTDLTQIAAAIVSAPVTVEQRRAATPLVQAYVNRFQSDVDKYEVLAVENPWYLWLEPSTMLVGVMDANRVNLATGQYEELELKTRRAPRIKKNGQPYIGDTEGDWVNELVQSSQIAIYALARARASFLTPLGTLNHNPIFPANPKIRIRAAIKSDPPQLWPTKDDAVFEFNKELLDYTAESIISSAASIRARKLEGKIPWQLTGNWCRRYNRDCEFLTSVCNRRLNGRYAEPLTMFSGNDPGSKAIEKALAESNEWKEEELVILSASAYTDYAQCAELYRLKNGGWFAREEGDALGIGTAFHAGAAEFNRSMIKPPRWEEEEKS